MDRRRVEQLRIDGIDRERLNRRDGDVVGDRRPRRAVVRRPPNAAAVGPDVERCGDRRMWHDGCHASAERRRRRVARYVDGLRPDGHPSIARERHEEPGIKVGSGVAYRARQGVGRRHAAGRVGPLQDEPALAVVRDRRRDDAGGHRPVDVRERDRRHQDRRQRQFGQHPRCVSRRTSHDRPRVESSRAAGRFWSRMTRGFWRARELPPLAVGDRCGKA